MVTEREGGERQSEWVVRPGGSGVAQREGGGRHRESVGWPREREWCGLERERGVA